MNDHLLTRVARGEQAAFKECIDRYGRMIWGLARKLSPTHADAEDATQDVFLHLWQQAKRFDATRGSEAIFIATLARRTMINRFRQRQRQPQQISVEELDPTGWQPSIASNSEAHSEARLAAQALQGLSQQQQQVIKLSIVAGLSHGEIARTTGLPLGTVKALLRRGLLVVREKLGMTAAAMAEVNP